MRLSTGILGCAAAPLLVSSSPLFRRVDPADAGVFKFACVLEDFENTFYQKALQKFKAEDFTNAGFTTSQIPIEQFSIIQEDENTHLQALTGALESFGEKPISGCQFKVDDALKDVTTMAATARVFENVGVAAYLGALQLMKDPTLLTTGGTIATIEARHSSLLNLFSSKGTAIPSAFDLALNPSEVLAIVSPFISGCELGIKAATSLTITNTDPPKEGTLLTFQAETLNGQKDNLFCQMLVGGATFTISLSLSQCNVPAGVNGPVAVWVTNDTQPLAGSPGLRSNQTILAGPAFAFVDTKPQSLNQLIAGGKNGGGVQTSTATLTSSGDSSQDNSPTPTPEGDTSPSADSVPTPNATPLPT